MSETGQKPGSAIVSFDVGPHKVTPPPAAERDSHLLRQVLDKMSEIEAKPAATPFDFRSLADLEDWAKRAAASEMVPKNYRGKPNDIILAAQWGYELGLKPLQALNSIAVINGRPGIFGDAMPGICLASGKMEWVREWAEGDEGADNYTRHCEVKRRGNPNPFHAEFSIGDAKIAKLWSPEERVTREGQRGPYTVDNDSPWHRFPKRMLTWRARMAYRDAFPDVLRGLLSVEELRDIAPEEPAAEMVQSRNALDRINARYAEATPPALFLNKGTIGPAKAPEAEETGRNANDAEPGPMADGKTPGPADAETTLAKGGPAAPHTESKPADDPVPANEMQEDAAKPPVMTHDGKQKLRDWITELKLKVGVARTVEDIRAIDQGEGFTENLELVRKQKTSLATEIEDLIDSKADWIGTMMREKNHNG